MLTVKRLSFEVLTQRPVARLIVLQGVVSVCTQSAGEHSDVPEYRLKRLVEDVGHLVLEVLRRHQRVEEVRSKFTLHCFDLTASARHVRIRVECLPQMVQRGTTRTSTDIEKDADIGIQRLAEGVEAPSVRVELALVLLLETEEQLDRNNALLGTLELEIRVQRHLCRVLVNVSLYSLLVDEVLGDAVLVHTHGGQRVERTGMNLLATIRDDADDDLLPSLLTPGAGLGTGAEVRHVLHNGVHGASEIDLVLVVHGDADEQFRLASSAADALSQLVSTFDKVVGVACDGCVAHVSELDLVASRKETVENGRNLALEHELAVDELDLLLGHLRGTHAATLLLSVRCRPIMMPLFVSCVVVLVFVQGLLGPICVAVPHRPAFADIGLGSKHIVTIPVQRN